MRTEDWLQAATEQTHPLLKSWFSAGQLKHNLQTLLARDLDWLENLGAGFAERIPMAGATAAMYNHRVCKLHDETLMLGIRFRGGDPDFPFVDVLRGSHAVTHADQALRTAALARDEFAVFKPKAVRFHQPSHQAFQFDLPNANARGDQRVLGAPLTQMLERPKPPGWERVRLQRTETIGFYERYAQTYAEAYRQRPWLPHESSTHSREDMQEFLRDAVVLEVFVDDEWAGLTGGERREDEFGLAGFVVIEMLLTDTARGQGLGLAVQRHLAETLVALAQPGDVLYGTIGANNPPMLKTALRAGRVDLGGGHWLML